MAWFAQGGDATMGQFLHRYNAPSGGALWTLALTLICFTLTSETWISWHYHLMELAGSATADALAMVVGYLCQALGMAIAVRIARTWPSRHDELPLACIIAAHFTCAVPAVLGTNLMGTATFGLLMNVLCGVIAARYLVALKEVGKDMYNPLDDRIEILDKDGSIHDVTEVSDMLNIDTLSKHVRKYYLCTQRIEK